jgi:hypothetical protein
MQDIDSTQATARKKEPNGQPGDNTMNETFNTTDLYRTPSYLGGSFTVRIHKVLANGKLEVIIHMPGNSDFHGNKTVRSRDALSLI